jgi:hypothetical protein
VQVVFDGELVQRSDQRTVGFVNRVLDTHLGEARHIDWRLDRDLQGQGRARQALAATIQLYRRLGIHTIYVDCSEVGRYVWAAAGFDFLEPWMRVEVLDSVRPMARRLGYELDDDSLPNAWSLAMLDDEITGQDALDAEDSAMVPLSELNIARDQPIRLGKALMLSGDCVPWAGVLRLQDEDPGFVRLASYLESGS